MSDQTNRLWQLLEQGQSVWLDSIRRGQIKSGELERLTEEDALRGETANPTIFEKAIDGSRDYDDQVIGLARQGLDANAIYIGVNQFCGASLTTASYAGSDGNVYKNDGSGSGWQQRSASGNRVSVIS